VEVNITPLSGVERDEGNAYVFDYGEYRLLMDCGAGATLPPAWVESIDRLDAIWLSHAHWDHVGALPYLRARFPEVPVYSTRQTGRFTRLSLSARAQSSKAGRRARACLEDNVCWLEFHSWVDWVGGTDDGTRIRLMAVPAGHILGAAALLIHADSDGVESMSVLYTGDFCLHDQSALPGFQPNCVPVPIDVLVMEGALGSVQDADAATYLEEIESLVEFVSQTGVARLVPVNQLDSALEVVDALTKGQVDFVVHNGLRAALDAAGFDVTATHHTGECRRLLEGGQLVVVPGKSLTRNTPAADLASSVIGDPKARIGLINILSGRSPAQSLLRAARRSRISWGHSKVRLRATVRGFSLPNHAAGLDLQLCVEELSPGQVVLVHGPRARLEPVAARLKGVGYPGRIEIPRDGVPYSLISAPHIE
jgi:Cft2 family RNA processing exonuclease